MVAFRRDPRPAPACGQDDYFHFRRGRRTHRFISGMTVPVPAKAAQGGFILARRGSLRARIYVPRGRCSCLSQPGQRPWPVWTTTSLLFQGRKAGAIRGRPSGTNSTRIPPTNLRNSWIQERTQSGTLRLEKPQAHPRSRQDARWVNDFLKPEDGGRYKISLPLRVVLLPGLLAGATWPTRWTRKSFTRTYAYGHLHVQDDGTPHLKQHDDASALDRAGSAPARKSWRSRRTPACS